MAETGEIKFGARIICKDGNFFTVDLAQWNGQLDQFITNIRSDGGVFNPEFYIAWDTIARIHKLALTIIDQPQQGRIN